MVREKPIKSKLLTAVTTAGLLASLFGTALLPVAKAAASTITGEVLTPTGSKVVSQVDAATWHVIAGAAVDIDVQFDVSNADGVEARLTTTGTTIKSVQLSADVTSAQIAPSAKMVSFGFIDDFANVDVQVTVYGPAAGTSATVTIDDYSIYLVGVSANLTGVPYTNGTKESTHLEAACHSQDSDGMGGGGAACSDTDYIEYGGHIAYTLRVKDAYKAQVTSGYFINASVTGGVGGVEINYNADAEDQCSDDESATDKELVDSGRVEICFLSDGTPSKPVTLTVSVGSITFTRKIGILGDVASLTLDAPTAIASIGADNLDAVPEAWGDSFAVVAKDVAGNIIGNGGGKAADFDADGSDMGSYDNYYRGTHDDGDMGFADDVEFVATDENGAVLDHSTESSYDDCYSGGSLDDCAYYDGGELTSSFEDEGAYVADGADSYSYAEQGNGVYTVPEDLCEPADAGTTIKVYVTGGEADLIKSNTESVKCAEDAVKLSGATQSVTSQVKNGSVKFTFSATDGNGSPVGDGATRSVAWESSWGDTGTCSLEFMGGAATCSVTADPTLSGAHFVILSVTDNDPFTTGVQAWAEKYNVSVTNAADAFTAPSFYKSTVVKARAVAIFPGAAGKTITFTVENARTGVVRTYYRKANADGKAWYTIAARGTYYVTALYGDTSTNTIKLVK